MSSYFDYFCKNVENVNSNSEVIRGTCFDMCPEDEIRLREREGLVHVLEVLGDERKFIKSYSRSAADSNVAIAHLLRPSSVLRDTVDYLLLDVSRRTDVSVSALYDFINDRLRAIRQDMTIQRLPPEERIHLLEPMIRFYVYFGFRLCDQPIKDFDPVLNKKYLLECIKEFLKYSESIQSDNSGIHELTGILSTLELANRSLPKLVCDRPLMESLYILCNLDDVHPLYRYLSLSKDLRCHPSIKLCYKIALAYLRGNYITVCKMIEKLCPLAYCALYTHLPTIQRQALRVMSFAYNSKQLTIPIEILRRWLWFASDADVTETCQHYGLRIEGAAVKLCKADFKTDVDTHQPKKNYLYEDKLNINIKNIFTYTSQERC